MADPKEAFWIVWSPQGTRPPSVRHISRAGAIAEAKRLAAACPGSEALGLASVGCAKRVDVEWTDHGIEIPF